MSAGARGVFNAAYEPLLFDVVRLPFPAAGRERETLEALERAAKDAAALEKMERSAFHAHEKEPGPFTPAKSAGRKGKSDRVVLAELFLSAHDPNAVAPEIAVSNLLKTFKGSELAVLEYHAHYPQPDPLSCQEVEYRLAFYCKALERPPVMILNGTAAGSTRGAGGALDPLPGHPS